jgi:hypothetical protein
MEETMKTTFLLALLMLLVTTANAQAPQQTAKELLTACKGIEVAHDNKAWENNSKGGLVWNKTNDGYVTQAVYEGAGCLGFIRGWQAATDNAFRYSASVKKFYFVRIVVKATGPDVVKALAKWVDKNPPDSDKPADEILFRVFQENKMFDVRPIPNINKLSVSEQ